MNNNNNNKNKRGGVRPGAGRHPHVNKKVPVTIRHYKYQMEVIRKHITGKELANRIRTQLSIIYHSVISKNSSNSS